MDWSGWSNLVHGICTFRRQWLPGDRRGWRSRGHRVHSSGDYRSPPPEAEHAGLRRHMAATVTDAPIELQRNERALLGAAFALKLNKLGGEVVILACSGTHLHVLYQSLGGDALAEFGRAKQYASYRMTHRPGGLWAGGGKVVRVRNIAQAEKTFEYVARHGPREGAWVWRADCDARPTRAMLDALACALRAEAGSDDRREEGPD